MFIFAKSIRSAYTMQKLAVAPAFAVALGQLMGQIFTASFGFDSVCSGNDSVEYGIGDSRFTGAEGQCAIGGLGEWFF